MNTERADQYIAIFRNLTTVILGIVLLVHAAFYEHPPSALVVGAGLGLLGVTPFVLADQSRRQRKARNGEQESEDERWTHLP